MALQDLTPQIRTRLNRMERVVGWFVLLATALMLAGFGCYLYNEAEQRGWFLIKAPYYTYTDSGSGLAVGDPVRLMGFDVGRITRILPMPARGKGSEFNVKIQFEVVGTNYSYIWTNSAARILDSGFLGKRLLDVTKGTKGYTVYVAYRFKEMSLDSITNSAHFDKLRLGEELYDGTNLVLPAWKPIATNLETISRLGISKVWTIDPTRFENKVTAVWNDQTRRYEPFAGTNIYGLVPFEPPALMDRVQGVVAQVEQALPNFLKITNQIAATLSNTAALTSNLNVVAENARPIMTNLAVITANIKDPHGSLGEWLIPTNVNRELALTLFNANATLTNVNGTVTNVNTNLAAVFEDAGRALDNLAGMTSNLNHQVEVNSNMLTQISDIVVHTDQFVQGLKRHWLLRSAFKTRKTNAPPASASAPRRLSSPKQ
jgi:ABC-type transporter Mla subunit MlaD